MARVAEQVRNMWAFGHMPNFAVYEPALAMGLPLDRRETTKASQALAAGRLIADMLVVVLPCVSTCEREPHSFALAAGEKALPAEPLLLPHV